MAIRNMKFSDLDNVVRLYQDANLFAKASDIKRWTEEGLQQCPKCNLVYEQDGKAVGAISAVRKRNVVEINDIGILISKRNKGIGTQLMNRLMSTISRIGVHKIILWVHWKNARAIPFYYKFGFKIRKVMKTKQILGVPDGEDIIFLERTT
ncbi:MAG: GNAT family N-acetyltransferase [Candidatus Woesearchaeota archaeon]